MSRVTTILPIFVLDSVVKTKDRGELALVKRYYVFYLNWGMEFWTKTEYAACSWRLMTEVPSSAESQCN